MERDKLLLKSAEDAISLLEDTIEELRKHPDRLISGEEWLDWDPILLEGEVESYVPQIYTVKITMKPGEQA